MSKSSKAGQEQFSHPTISWGSSILPVQVWLLSLIQQTPGMSTCNYYGCSDSYSIVVDFTVWKRWLQNTCELNEPCRCWNDIDGECVYFTKFEEGKMDKACKKRIQIICLCMKQVWFLQWECNFFPIRTAYLGRRDLERKKKEGYDYCYLFLESSLHHLTPSRRNKSYLGKTAFSPIWTSFFL